MRVVWWIALLACFGTAATGSQVGGAAGCKTGIDAATRGELAMAEPALKECVGSARAPLEAFLMLAGIYQSRRDAEGVYRVVSEGMKRYPDEKRFYLTAGAHLGRERQFDDAVRVLSAAEKRWPGDEKIRELLASALFARGSAALDAGEDLRAVEDLRRAVLLAPEDVEALMNLGRARHNLARYEEALEAFDRVAKLQPGVPLLRFHRGMSYYALGDFERAVADLDAQLSVDDSYAPGYLVRGLARLSKGEDEPAAQDLARATAALPGNAAARLGLGRALLRLRRLEEAETHLRAAMKFDPEDPAPVHTLVTVLSRLDRREEARELAKTAADLAKRRRTAAPGEIRFEPRPAVAR
jgi:tetratricopeptide (TPR) repeat protein